MERVVQSFIHAREIFAAVVLGCFILTVSPAQVSASAALEVETLIKTTCSTCHKFEGKEESRFNLKAPDLMWGGSKYQRDWLIRWLTGKEPMLYAKSYRWDQGQEPDVHMAVTLEQANAIVNKVITQGGVLDMQAITDAATQATISTDNSTFKLYLWVIIVCWLISIVDAWVTGKKSTETSV